jgi:C1A family cysteine protease
MTLKRSLYAVLLAILVHTFSSVAFATLPAGQGAFAPLNPEFLALQNMRSSSVQSAFVDRNRLLGERPSPLDLSHVLPPKSAGIYARSNATLPSKYDLREHGVVLPIRDQAPFGTCWAFGALASLESTLKKAGTGGFDFSEWHLAYFAYVDESETLPAFTAYEPEFGEEPIFDQGGNNWKSTAILARWTGAVNEADRPYQHVSPWPESSKPLPSDPPSMRLKHVHHLGAEFNSETIKLAVMTHGSVRIRVVWKNSAYNPGTFAFFNPDGDGGGHAVNIVGWDDDYPAGNFSADPKRNGAWIMQNSWGENWGDSGFFYLSYADPTIGTPSLYLGGTTTEFEHIYQYDPLGWVESYGFESETAAFANIFTAVGPDASKSTGGRTTEFLRAVSFYAAQANASYRIEVRRGVDEGAPGSGTFINATVGSLAAAGYHTIMLSKLVPISPGERFSVVVRLTTPGYLFPVPLEQPVQGYSDKATALTGQSFVSPDGSVWTDMTELAKNTNVCLKAFSVTGTLSSSSSSGCSVDSTANIRMLLVLLPLAPLLFRR